MRAHSESIVLIPLSLRGRPAESTQLGKGSFEKAPWRERVGIEPTSGIWSMSPTSFEVSEVSREFKCRPLRPWPLRFLDRTGRAARRGNRGWPRLRQRTIYRLLEYLLGNVDGRMKATDQRDKRGG